LSGAVAARIALVVETPIARDIPDAPLAFAIASRRNLARERDRSFDALAARAAPQPRACSSERRGMRCVVHRPVIDPRRIVGPEGALEPVWSRLLADREPLVWRHVAIARGLLRRSPRGHRGPRRQAAPRWSATEWRRAAAGIGGIAASKPDVALKMAARAFREAFWIATVGPSRRSCGASRAAECEPEAARELLAFADASPPDDAADAVAVLVRELGDCAFSDHGRERARARLTGSVATASDDGVLSQRASLARELSREGDEDGLADKLARAVNAFASDGARAAHERGLEVLEAARGAVDTLLAIGDEDGDAAQGGLARRTSYAVVRELDVGLLERDVLVSLLRLDNREGRAKNASEAVEHLRDRIFVWLVERELSAAPKAGPVAVPAHPTLHFARLRALLHLVDGEGLGRGEDAERRVGFASDAARALEQASRKATIVLRRALMATFARCLVPSRGRCDRTWCSPRLRCSVTRATSRPLPRRRWTGYARPLGAPRAGRHREPPRQVRDTNIGDSLFPPAPRQKKHPTEAALDALDRFGEELARVGSARDGLRTVVTKLCAAFAPPTRRVSATSVWHRRGGHRPHHRERHLRSFAAPGPRAASSTSCRTRRCAPVAQLSARLGRTVAGNPTLDESEIERPHHR
jgi:hypothetical protein